MSTPAVFLDRDGVLAEPVRVVGGERPAWTLDELRPIAGAAAALAELRGAGFLLVMVTNQPDIARGDVAAGAVDSVNESLAGLLGLDAVYTCPHDGPDRCACRKPLPGMILDAAATWDVDMSASWMLGDRWVDVAAGRAAGVRTILLETASSWWTTSAGSPDPELRPDARVTTLEQATALILESEAPVPPAG